MNRLEILRKERLSIAAQAAKIYDKRTENLEQKLDNIVERNNSFHKRSISRSDFETRIFATERIIRGKDESREFPPDLLAKNHGLPVARLYDLAFEQEPKGFATGFLVAPNILITNHHVFKTAHEANNCAANFSYEKDQKSREILPGTNFLLRPEVFFYTCEELDFTLLYVEEESVTGNLALKSFGLLPLIATKGKVTFNSRLNIIQYPGGGIKKYACEENFITDIDDEKGILFYSTDTQTGASGAPCYNEFWEVSGLHYTGVPRLNEKGEWMTINNEVWNEEMDDDDVDWIANAGKSISKIVSHLKNARLTGDGQKYIDQVLFNSSDPLDNATEHHEIPTNQHKLQDMKNITMNFNGPTNVYISQGDAVNSAPSQPKEMIVASGSLEKAERFDENYAGRKGYDEDFIPGFKVPMPEVTDAVSKDLYKNFGADVPYVVPYHHYSLVMHKQRRMLMWAASNVDYDPSVRDGRKREDLGSGAWRLDGRIPSIYQIQASEFYDPATLVDKGHIVRRDDNVWEKRLPNGDSNSLGIEYANADTFHWTNCTPQHEAFNRDMPPYKGIGLWGLLENEVKKQLDVPVNVSPTDNRDYGGRACVIAGPIFREDDPEYMGIKYPLRFFKVFAIKSKSEGNLVYGFILSQADKINATGLSKPKKEEGLPRFNVKVKALQVSLKEIEEQSGVLFDESLHEADVKARDASVVELNADMSNFKRMI